MKKLRGVSALAAALGAALVLSACGGGGGGDDGGGSGGDALTGAKGANGDGTYNAPEVAQGGDVTVAHEAPYTTYNNATADGTNFNNTLVVNPVLTEPFIVEDSLEVLLNADVMDSVELTSENPQVVTYKIKPNVAWSDGAAWDCDDFYLTWMATSAKFVQRGPDGQPILGAEGTPAGFFTPAGTQGTELVTAECTDDLTFVETYSEPYSDYKGNYIGTNRPMPAHILEQETGVADLTQLTPESPQDQIKAVAEFWNTGFNGFTKELMPGSGPYLIEGWQQGNSVTLVRNPEWIGNPGGPDRIILRSIEDATAQSQALENQELDVMAPQADPVVADRLRNLSAQGVTFQAGGGLTFEHLDMNLDFPLFQDVAVRQAFAQCIDRNDLVDKLIRGVAPEAAPLGSLLFLPEEPGYEDLFSDTMPADPNQAKQTLEAAGWALGQDSIYAKGGQRLSFRISHTGIDRRSQTVQLIQSHCREAGINIVNDADPTFLDERVSAGDYDVALFAWVGTPFKSSKISLYTTTGGQNWSAWSNPTVDEQMPLVATESDEDQRDEYLKTADQALAEAYLSLPLFQLPNMWAYNETVDATSYNGANGVTWNAWEWEIGQ